MRIVQQTASAILETDHHLTEAEARRIKADLQAIGIAAVILPMGVTVSAMTDCGLDPDDDE